MKSLMLGTVALTAVIVAALPASGAVIAITQAKANAGSVTPGDGPGFPVTISQPGSYVLDGNLSLAAGAIGIEVESHDVTIDGAGFRMHGNSQGGNVGIRSTRHNRLTVRNISIIGFEYGIRSRSWLIVEDARVMFSGSSGIVTENHAQIRNSTISQNSFAGIECLESCLIENNVISGNGLPGVTLATGNVRENIMQENGRFAITGGVVGASENVLLFNNSGSPGQVDENVHLFGPNLCRPEPDCKAP